MNVKLLVAGLVTVVFVWLVEHYLGWRNLLAPWRQLNLLSMTGALLLLFLTYGLRAVRIYDHFFSDMKGRFHGAFRLMLLHNLLNNFLPMRTGELSFPVLMQRYFSINALHSISGLLWFRILDLHTLLGLGLSVLGTLFFPLPIVILVAILWAAFPLLLFYGRRQLQVWCARRSEARLHRFVHQALTGLPQSGAEFWRSWAWTVLNWLVKIGVFVWVLLAFVDLPLKVAMVAIVAGDLTSVLPLHGLAGAGTYEAGVLAGTALFDVSLERVLAGAINLHLFLLGASLLGGGVALLIPWRNVSSVR